MTRLALGLAASLALVAPAAHAADLTITLHGVDTQGGNVRVALYATAETFKKEALAEVVASQPAHPGDVVFHLPGVAPGTYAVLAYHDANRNGKLDLVLGMFPDEGWGLSNDPEVIGPPPFADSAFAVADTPAAIDIAMRY